MPRLTLHLLALMIVIGIWPRAWAQSQQTKYVALVIGNSSYVGGSLPGPEYDAADMAALLVANKFHVSNIGNVANLNKAAMEVAINDFIAKVDENTFALLYYSGHGIELSGGNYLMPVDADGSSLNTLIPLDPIRKRLKQRDARTQLLILDACRNVPPHLRYAKKSTTGGLAQIKNLGAGTSIVYAATPGEIAIGALGKARNSVFTGALLAAAKEAGTFQQIILRAAALTEAATNKAQRPWIEGHAVLNINMVGSSVGSTLSSAGSNKGVDPKRPASWDPMQFPRFVNDRGITRRFKVAIRVPNSDQVELGLFESATGNQGPVTVYISPQYSRNVDINDLGVECRSSNLCADRRVETVDGLSGTLQYAFRNGDVVINDRMRGISVRPASSLRN